VEYDQRLAKIAASLDSGEEAPSLTVRELLKWFYVQRRGVWVVEMIRSSLNKHKLRTVPDFEGEYLDHLITFEKLDESNKTKERNVGESEALPDPTHRIGKLESANIPPVSVKPDDDAEKAVTLMLMNDFSQLPVMTSEREAKGMISWMSIGSRKALAKSCDKVRDCMDQHVEIGADTSLFDAIGRIVESQYVLIRAKDGRISGIVTTSDLSDQFKQLSEPFLLIGELENQIRRMLEGKFSPDELRSAKDESDVDRKIERISDLTFGEYRRLLEKPERWDKIGLALDRKAFIEKLDEVRRIRNDVMHFDPDGIPDPDLITLREFVGFFQTLTKMKAI